jgi:hypothetical protein
MKRLLLVCGVLLVLSWTCVAQTSDDESPATRADVERYFQVVKSHDMMKKVMAAMTPAMHQMMHEQYLKHQDELPADYESKMNAVMDTMFENMPMDEMMQAMVPVYQKHFTKGDIDNLVAFYSTPTGAKLLREMPTIMGEAMQDMMPIMTKYMDNVKETLLKQTNDMIAQAKKTSDEKNSATHN